ncbi:MAG TPA: hypothetical protein PK668_06960 [Myxococcota bacterium]|nr:hypothetical protein [Myxococcota bacterium]HRY92416.1 hypothetical protein [Myxococcota bacterium]HSA21842.1 hypothetical protein [Myxococcota bacterium]
MRQVLTHGLVGCLVASCLGLACGEGTDPLAGYPDPDFVYQASGQVDTLTDEAFLQERPSLYRTVDRLPDLDVRALAVVDGAVWAGTASGLLRLDAAQDRFLAVALPGGDGPVVDLAPRALADGRLVVALADRVALVPAAGGGESFPTPAASQAVAASGAEVWLGTAQGLHRLEAGSFVEVPEAAGLDVRDLGADEGGDLWLATPVGLTRLAGAVRTDFRAATGALPDDDVRALAALPGGGVLAACQGGAARVGTAADRLFPAGKGGLPTDELTAAAAGPDLFLVGHAVGASAVQGELAHVDHYHSLRWLPAERVTGVALEGSTRRWIATPAGLARIELVETDLAAKAALFQERTLRHWRLDFVSDGSSLADPWQPDGQLSHWDHDNDGLWTQMVVGAWSFAAAASGDAAYCELARRAMGGMMRQIDIPGVSFEAIGRPRGFVCRSFVRDDEGEVFTSKAPQANWHLVEGYEGHDYYWKDDTSSDETTGHFFGYPLFYDLCATPAEREVLREHIGALAHHIVDSDFRLLDLDGQRTTWGKWYPEVLAIALDGGLSGCMQTYPLEDCASAAYGGGWLNSIEILGHLLAAWHMTHDPVFYDAYDHLIVAHRYGELVDFDEDVWTVTKRAVANHSDHELAFLAYHTLIRYEPDDARRARWIQSMLDMYAWEVAERNPLWSAIVAGFQPEGYHLAEAAQTLREWPEDWREWLVDNSHRKDITPDGGDRHQNPQIKEVLPYDEIRTMKWNGNPYALADGGDGRSVQAPWPWLLPYWLYRYHGILQ